MTTTRKQRSDYNTYMREYMLRRYNNWRAMAVAQLGGCCAQCGATGHLEFDHIDPATKTFTIASGWSTSRARLEAEVAKCQLLCAACHDLKSASERSVEHGGGKTGKRNCRCDLCAPLKNKYMRERRLIPSRLPL